MSSSVKQPDTAESPYASVSVVRDLIREHQPMVARIAHRYARVAGPAIDLDDLMSVAVMALVEAYNLHDPSVGRPFRVYAEFRVRGAVLDELRRLDPMSQTMRRRIKAFRRTVEDLSVSLGKDPSDGQVAEALEVPVAEVRRLREGSSYRSVPLDKANPEELVTTLGLRPEAMSWKISLLGAIKGLSLRSQKLLSMYYFQDLSMQEIGKILGLTEARISQLHKGALATLHGALSKD